MQTPATPAASVYHLSVKPISRGVGRSATAAAAYRSGELIVDERTGEVHDYTRKGDVVHSEMIVPPGAPSWAEDRAALWNAAEAAEKRKDARVARDYEVAIPKELTRAQGIELVRDFAHQLADRYGVAVDVNVHSDELRNWDGSEKGYQGYHAHILTSTRKLGREGFGEKAEIELSDAKRKSLGLSDGAAEIEQIRQRWEIAANRHLERAGQSQRIDRRSLKDQGIDREPTVHLGPGVTALEREGISSRLGDINRQVVAEHQQKLDDQRRLVELQEEVRRIEAAQAPARAPRRPIDLSVLDEPEPKAERSAVSAASAAKGVLDKDLVASGLRARDIEAAVRMAMGQLIIERNERVRRVLMRAEAREARRQAAYARLADKAPPAPQGLMAAFQQKGHREAVVAWQAAKAAAAQLLDQARQLAQRLRESAAVQRLADWAHGVLKQRDPELVVEHRRLKVRQEAETKVARERPDKPKDVTREGEVAPAPSRSATVPERTERAQAPPSAEPGPARAADSPDSTPPPKRDWNRYKALQEQLAQQGRESLRRQGVIRDGPERELEIKKPEPKKDRGRSR